MSTTTIDDELQEVRTRIERLRALEETGVATERARIRRHLDILRRYEDAIGADSDGAPDDRIAQLRARVSVAEHAVAADLTRDWHEFTAAVDDELRSWDTFLERLQMSAATRAWKARAEAEAAIGQVRSTRISAEGWLALARHDASPEAREQIEAARDRLEQRADELSARIG